MIGARSATTLALAGALVVALAATFIGLQKALPYEPENDEPFFVLPAIRIAATGNLNPGWFGHPGATVIYPLAFIARLIGGSDVQAQFLAHPETFYLAGRWLDASYEVLAIPLVFLVGRAAFGSSAGAAGAGLSALLPIAVAHAQLVRSDSAAVFFGLLSLWLCLRTFHGPTRGQVLLVGAAIGLAIATRYFMVALVPIGLWSARRRAPLLLLGVAVAFACASPYALLDFATLRTSLAAENEASHVGADGLSPLGNLAWYLTQGLPADLTWPVAVLACIGIGLSVWRRNWLGLALLAYVLVHVFLISLSALHWHRWTIQLLPVLALFAGSALQLLRSPPRWALGLGLASVQLAAQLLVFDLQQVQTSPRVQARAWLFGNVRPSDSLAIEAYGPPLAGTGLLARPRFSLSDQPLSSYTGYLIASSAVYDRYYAEPERYAHEVAFYDQLFAHGQLLAEFRARAPGQEVLLALGGAECNCALHPTRGAPSLRIYRVGSAAARSGAASASAHP